MLVQRQEVRAAGLQALESHRGGYVIVLQVAEFEVAPAEIHVRDGFDVKGKTMHGSGFLHDGKRDDQPRIVGQADMAFANA